MHIRLTASRERWTWPDEAQPQGDTMISKSDTTTRSNQPTPADCFVPGEGLVHVFRAVVVAATLGVYALASGTVSVGAVSGGAAKVSHSVAAEAVNAADPAERR